MKTKKHEIRSLEYRQDDRSLEDFGYHILICTGREALAVKILKKSLLRSNKCDDINIYDNGMDNSGKVQKDINKVNSNPDFVLGFVIDGKESQKYIEMKVHSERYKTCTFKSNELKSYISFNACVVIFRENYYWILDKDAMQYIMKNITAKEHKSFAPGKLSYMLSQEEMISLENQKIIKKIRWESDEVKRHITRHKKFLFDDIKKLKKECKKGGYIEWVSFAKSLMEETV